MPSIKLTDSDGQTLYGELPWGWDKTPLAPYAALATATTMPEKCRATAALVGLPPEAFEADASLVLPVARACPWLFDGSLPDAGEEPLDRFEHRGRTYVHVGNLKKINAGQMEALLGFLQQHEGRPLTAGPHLLAVLYCPKGQKQTADVVQATAKAFADLPMSLAWPALASFLRSSSSAAMRIRIASALSEATAQMLAELEAVTGGASTTFWRKPLNWLTKTWIRNVRKML